MHRTITRCWFLIGFAMLGTACTTDRPTTPTGLAVSATLGQGADDDADGHGIDSQEFEDRPVSYAVIGDAPYEPLTPSAISVFPVLINSINQDPDVRRAIHVGDIKSGSTVCSDEWFQLISANFATFDDPLVYSIGDNEWTDCHRSNNGAYEPLERLARIRDVFFAQPGRTLGGKHRKVDAQYRYPENQRWVQSSVVFSTLHVIGSNNGRDPWFQEPGQSGETPEQTLAREAEYAGRNAANIKWLESAFQEATTRQAKGVVLFLHADLWHPADRAAGAIFTAHYEFVERLYRLAKKFKGPVLLISGDSHNLRVDAGVPWLTLYGLQPLSNMTQLIVDRSIEATTDATPVNWLKLTIDPTAAYPFSWTEMEVQE